MIIIFKRILILMFLFILALEAKSQAIRIDHKNFIGVNLTQIIFVDFRISYERRITPAHGIIIQLSYKPAFAEFTDATSISLGQDVTAWCYRNTASWYYGSIGYRYYFNHNKTIYLSPEVFYKKMLADKIIYSYGNGGTSNTYEVRSMDTDLIGINLLIGKRLRIKFSDSFNMGFDIFTGITVRLKNIFTTTYGSVTSNHYHDETPRPDPIPISDSPLEVKQNLNQIFVQFGIILYTSWK
jgi:hypothetical protein